MIEIEKENKTSEKAVEAIKIIKKQDAKEMKKKKARSRSNKGFFITMDAAMGLLVVVLVISTSITLVELTHQKSVKELTRQARNLYEYEYLGGVTPPAYIKVDCSSSTNKVSIDSFVYDDASNSIQKITTTVCE